MPSVKCNSLVAVKGNAVFADSFAFADADVCWLLVFVVSVQWLAIKEN